MVVQSRQTYSQDLIVVVQSRQVLLWWYKAGWLIVRVLLWWYKAGWLIVRVLSVLEHSVEFEAFSHLLRVGQHIVSGDQTFPDGR